MSVVYDVSVKTERMTATRDHFANGSLEIGTASMASVLASFTLSASGGSVTNGVWTIGVVTSSVNALASGNAQAARLKTQGNSTDLTGLTVAVSGGDITINQVAINGGQVVNLTSATVTHAL